MPHRSLRHQQENVSTVVIQTYIVTQGVYVTQKILEMVGIILLQNLRCFKYAFFALPLIFISVLLTSFYFFSSCFFFLFSCVVFCPLIRWPSGAAATARPSLLIFWTVLTKKLFNNFFSSSLIFYFFFLFPCILCHYKYFSHCYIIS